MRLLLHTMSSDRHPRSARAICGFASLALVLVAPACGDDDGPTLQSGTTASGTGAGTTVEPTTTADEPASSTTAETSTTVSSSTSADPTTTDSVPDAAPVTLRFDGIGAASLGQDRDETLAALSAALGEPGETNPWVQPSCELAGPDSDGASSVAWGGLRVHFRGQSEATATFAGWTYLGGAAGPLTELTLESGVGVADPGDDLAEAYGAAATYVPFEVFEPHWEVIQGAHTLWAPVDADAPGASIVRMDLDPGICE